MTFEGTPLGPFKVVSCAPEWNRTSQGAVVQAVESQDPPIVIRVPTAVSSAMKQGIAAAVAAWNSALDAYGAQIGPRFDDVESDTPCSGPNCVNVEIGEMNLSEHCALANLVVDSATGLIQGSTIRFPPQSSGWSASFNARLAAHELGHHLGLQDSTSSCATVNSLMKPVACGAASGYPTAPTLSDHWPAATSTYSGASTLVCR